MLVPDCPAAAPTSSIWDEAVTQLIGGTPPWFPYGVPIVSTWQIPLIKSPLLDEIPEVATAYDKRGQTVEPASTVLHGYVQDGKLRTQLTSPQEWVVYRKVSAAVFPDGHRPTGPSPGQNCPENRGRIET